MPFGKLLKLKMVGEKTPLETAVCPQIAGCRRIQFISAAGGLRH